MSTTFNPFARHVTVQVQPGTETAVEQQIDSKPINRPKPGQTRKSPPAPRLLYWLQHSWARPLISLSQIVTYGPWNIRDRKSALAQAELLEQAGWLIPVVEHQRDWRTRVWRSPIATIGRSELQRELQRSGDSRIGGLAGLAG
jgi:hypothetical protein